MPNILLYEFLTGGGLLANANGSERESLRREGAAMIAALAADFSAIDGVATTVLLDSRQDTSGLPWTRCRIIHVKEPGGDCAALSEPCRDADWTVAIAPEFDGLLEARSRIVETAGGRLLGPSSRLVAMAADKQRTAEHLTAAGVPTAFGQAVEIGDLLDAAESIGYPTVIKPRDGAGSKDVRLLADRDSAARFQSEYAGRDESPLTPGPSPARGEGKDDCYRLERFYPGVAASVAVLCGPMGLFPLPACRQCLSDDGRFRYLGGSCPLEPALARRAASLAIQAIHAIRSLPEPLGYLGVDLVLGADPEGQKDLVIEINPRLTTSYVGLRAIADGNLAAAMLAAAEGREPQLSFSDRMVEFDCDGTIHRASATAARCGARRA